MISNEDREIWILYLLLKRRPNIEIRQSWQEILFWYRTGIWKQRATREHSVQDSYWQVSAIDSCFYSVHHILIINWISNYSEHII